MFGGLFVEVWRRCCGRVWCGGDRFSGGFEDNWSGGAFDVVVFVAGWDCGGVNPALSFGGVEVKAEFLHVCGYGVEGVLDVGVVCDYVNVVHVSSRGCVGCGDVQLFVGLGECGVESECESRGGKGASHGNSAIRGMGLCSCVVKAALVGGLGGDPWSHERFVFGVVSLDGFYDGAVV